MRTAVLCLLTLFCVSIAYSQKRPKIIPDPKNQKPMIVGKCSRSALEKGTFNEWFSKEYTEYKVDTKTIDQLAKQWKDIRIVLVMGTWCGDSKREVPRLFKILDYAKFRKKNIKTICVDRDKKADKFDISSYKVLYVPTIIIYRGGVEMGRIIENPVETLEKDLLKYIGRAE